MLKLFGLWSILAGLAFAQATGPFAGGLVTGVPYSADEVIEMTPPASGAQTSTPAVVIHKFRDSAGRTRTERPKNMGPEAASGNDLTVIEINDPVAGVQYTLDPQSKIAHKRLIPPLA